MSAATTPSREAVEGSLGQVVLYHAAEGDDAPELAAFPLSSDMQTFAAIVARVHPRSEADLMVVDPSKGPMRPDPGTGRSGTRAPVSRPGPPPPA